MASVYSLSKGREIVEGLWCRSYVKDDGRVTLAFYLTQPISEIGCELIKVIAEEINEEVTSCDSAYGQCQVIIEPGGGDVYLDAPDCDGWAPRADVVTRADGTPGIRVVYEPVQSDEEIVWLDNKTWEVVKDELFAICERSLWMDAYYRLEGWARIVCANTATLKQYGCGQWLPRSSKR